MKDGAFRILEIVDRAQNGPACTVKDFDLKLLPGKIKELQKEYNIKYDPEQPVPNDNSLVDDLYKAGLQLLLDLGILCLDTERRITFTEEEIKHVLRDHPSQVTVGQGKDARPLYNRKIEDTKVPVIHGGPVASLLTPGRPYVDAITSMAQESIISIIVYGSISSIEGRPILMGSPLEIHAARSESRWMREAAARAGRPGLALVGSMVESAAAEIANSDPIMGYRPTDARNACLLSSLKVNYTQLNKVKHFLDYGTFIYGYHNDIIGSYTGGAEGSAIACVASAIGNVLVNCATFHCIGVPHIHNLSTSGPLSIWAQHHVAQAIARNTHIIDFGSLYSGAGPCTDMMLYESAAIALLAVSGANLIGTMGRASKEHDRCTGLEQRFLGEIGYAATKLKRDETNEVTKRILALYQNRLADAPVGKTFQECYDLKTLQPSEEWQQIYETVKNKMRDLGIPVE